MEAHVEEMPPGQAWLYEAIAGATPPRPFASDGAGMNMSETRKPAETQKINRGQEDETTSIPPSATLDERWNRIRTTWKAKGRATT